MVGVVRECDYSQLNVRIDGLCSSSVCDCGFDCRQGPRYGRSSQHRPTHTRPPIDSALNPNIEYLIQAHMVASQSPAFDIATIRERVDLAAKQIAKFKVKFILNPKFMTSVNNPVASLSWSSVKYGLEELHKVPDDTRGVYAFVVSHCDEVLPMHGYVMYVGIAGQRSDRSLRARYRDYLNNKKILKRDRVTTMIGNWSDLLHFVYAPVADSVSADELMALEQEINSALLPPYSPGDRKARVKAMERMFP